MNEFSRDYKCQICGYETEAPHPSDLGEVRGNDERFFRTIFHLWKCPRCLTIYSVDPVDFKDIYLDYVLLRRRLDFFARATSGNLLSRLKKAGLRKADSILDVGCGNGVFLKYLANKGYQAVGYDPYVPEYCKFPENGTVFDCVVNNDTIEHCSDVRENIKQCLSLLKKGGLLYIGTADSGPVNMSQLDSEVMRVHQPYHRVIFTEQTLHNLVAEFGLEVVHTYRRSYHDTLTPFVNYRFLDELNKALDHNLDRALDPKESGRVISTSPMLWFYGIFGYLFPSAWEPAVVVRNP